MSADKKEGRLLIVGHRGMGLGTLKPRDEYIQGAVLYPENSIAAFVKALSSGTEAPASTVARAGAGAGAGVLVSEEASASDFSADGIECDIHVSKDGQAMVIHGSRLLDYADFIGSIESDNLSLHPIFGNTERLSREYKVEKYTVSELQELFTLKAHDIETSKGPFDKLTYKGIKGAEGKSTPSEKQQLPPEEKQNVLCLKKELHSTFPDTHKIPTLTELLQMMLVENRKRQEGRKQLAKMNIELKGEGSAIASIRAIMEFYKENPEAKEFVRPEDIIFLGKQEGNKGRVGEIVIANRLLEKSEFLLKSDGRELSTGSRIAKELHGAKTNAMISTEQLYGLAAITDGNYNLTRGCTSICRGGREMVKKVYTDGCDGVDITLFDSCSDVLATIQQVQQECVATNPHRSFTIGMAAAGWKGTSIEGGEITVAQSVDMADSIARSLGVDLLLKVDEPHMFKRLLIENQRVMSGVTRDSQSVVVKEDLVSSDIPPIAERPTRSHDKSLWKRVDWIAKGAVTAPTTHAARVTPIILKEVERLCRSGNFDLVKERLEEYPDITRMKDNNGNTFLHFAAHGGHKNICELLLSRGADPRLPNKAGKTAVESASAFTLKDFLRTAAGKMEVPDPGRDIWRRGFAK